MTDVPHQLDAQFWELIKSRIKARNEENKLVETWIDPMVYIDTIGSKERPRMRLGVPSPLHQYFVIENLLEQIYSEISAEYKSPYEVDLIISPQQVQSRINEKAEAMTGLRPSPGAAPKLNSAAPAPNPQISFAPNTSAVNKQTQDILNPDYTFSTFVVGRNTEFAHAASYNVAQNPGQGYNPLFICGPVGMGKTHLLHAVGHELRNAFPQFRIAYLSAERFLNECVSALRRQEMDKFRSKYRENSDILLVDDVQYIGRGEATQEEFFHMLNSFIEKRKQVVLASDRMPKDILSLEDRNRSRLEWGLIADISMSDLETRVAILRYKAEKLGIRLSDEVVNYIARISKRSIRELEGNLKKVKMFSDLQGLQIDLELSKRVLSHHETTTTMTMEDIQKMVAEHFQVKLSDMKSTNRSKAIVVPRQISMFLIKKHLDKPLVDIGRAFGGKDHTTVLNALDRVSYLQSKNLEIRNDIDEITTRIHNVTGL